MTYPSERGRISPPNLDDRTWQDLVDEVRKLIPVYAPQWTDRNPSDPGITIIEMFAMLVEGLIYRLNRVPDAHYIAFLNLLGITRNPPTPALTYLTFTSAEAVVVVPAGTQAQTVASELDPAVVFETDADATILPINLKRAAIIGPYTGSQDSLNYQDKTDVIVGPPTGRFPLSLAKDETVQLCFGFDHAIREELGVRLVLSRPLLPGQASVECVYSADQKDPHEWPTATTATDGTNGLADDGYVRLTVSPDLPDWEAQVPTATGPNGPSWQKVTPAPGSAWLTEPLHWIGLRIHNTTDQSIAAGVDRFLFNSALARNALTIRAPELLGRATGQPFQQFTLAHAPLHAAIENRDALVVEVGQGTPPEWEEWQVVDDLPAGEARVCRADQVTGVVTFGNFDAKTKEGHGAMPPDDAQVRARTYRYVAGGASGNVAAQTITVIGTTVAGRPDPPGISAVTNLGPAFDGSDEEPIDETLRRAPDVLKTSDRAVTAEDYETLARQATTDVHTVRCLGPLAKPDGTPFTKPDGTPWTFGGLARAPGSVYVVVVPDKGPDEPRPEPSPNLIRDVAQYLDRRRDLTSSLTVVGPRYLPVTVTAELNVWNETNLSEADKAQLEADMKRRINVYLHPTRGGPNKAGWELGQPVFASDLFREIMPPADTAHIASLKLSAEIPAYHIPSLNPDGTPRPFRDDPNDPDRERPFRLTKDAASVRVADYEIVCAADNHTIEFQRD